MFFNRKIYVQRLCDKNLADTVPVKDINILCTSIVYPRILCSCMYIEHNSDSFIFLLIVVLFSASDLFAILTWSGTHLMFKENYLKNIKLLGQQMLRGPMMDLQIPYDDVTFLG